jgi:hypothetical protein
MKSRKVLRHKRRLTRTNQTLRKYKRQRGGSYGIPLPSNKHKKYTVVTVTANANEEDSIPTTMSLEQAEDILEDVQM